MHLFRTVKYSAQKEEWLPEDKANVEQIAMSLACKSLEKELRNRKSERSENAMRYVKEGNVSQALVFTSQLEEDEDILLWLSNIRDSVTKRDK